MNRKYDSLTAVLVEEQKVDSDERWRTAFENSAIGIALLDLNGRFVTVNPSYQKMLGYSAAEFQAISCLEITFEEDQGTGRRLFSELLAGKRSHIQVEKRLRRKDGTPIWIRLNESLVPGTEKTEPFLLAVVEDITDHKRAEEASVQSEFLYREVLNNIPACLFALDVTSDGRFKFAWFNQAEEKAVGFLSAQVAGRFVEDVLSPELAAKVIQHYRCCAETEALTQYEDELDLPIGRKYFHSTLIPVRSAQGRIYRIIGCCNDLTEIKRSQEEAFVRQKLESLGVLAEGIAHDFNNLLASILTNAELAEAQLAEGKSPIEEIQTVRAVAIRTAEIVRELFVYSGQDQATLETADVSRLVEEMLQLLKVSISKHAALKTNLAKELPAVRLNSAQIRQILMNLIVNASESLGDKDGTISISTSLASKCEVQASFGKRPIPNGSEYICLQVSDTGHGIPEDVRTKIFDPFFTTKFAGRGLGLSVVEGIVRAHAGAIDVTSALGQGTTFTILLPCVAPENKGGYGIAITGSGENASPASGTVLLIEDEAPLRVAVGKMLRQNGFSVIEAGDGRAAFDILQGNRNNIDALLLDMTLPGIPPNELMEEARRTRPDIKIVLTSAYSQETVMNGIESRVVHAFIRKPFRLGTLTQLLKEVLAAPSSPTN